MPVKRDPDTQKWQIGDGIPRYHTELSARAAYDNYLKRGGKPVEPAKQHSGKLG